MFLRRRRPPSTSIVLTVSQPESVYVLMSKWLMESRARDGKFILLCYTSISCQQLPDNKKMRTIGKTVSSSLLTYFSFVHVNLISQCFHFNFNISYFAKRKGSLGGKCSPFLFLLMSLAGSPDNINIYRVLINY